MIEKIIENFNLNEKEAKVYLACLELGKSKVSEIAKKAQLNRITAYEILKRLSQKGIANSITYKDITYFQVINPEKLVEKIQRQAELAREALPELMLISKTGKGKPKVDYYEGVEGLRTVYEDSLSSQEKIIYNIANVENLIKGVGKEFLDNYIKKRTRKKIKVKVLIPDTSYNRQYAQERKGQLREVKFFKNKEIIIPNEIMIYDDKISLLSFSSKIGVIIQDKEIAQSIRSMWHVFWESV